MTTATPPGDPAPGSEQGNGSAEGGSAELSGSAEEQTIDPNDYLARIRSDPEFAAQEVQKHQSAAGVMKGRLKKADAAIRAAELVGNGNLEAGGSSLADVASVYTRIVQNEQMAELVGKFLQTGVVPEAGSSLDEDYEDPNEKALRDLQTKVDQVEVRTAKSEMMGQIEHYFKQDPIGMFLEAEERGEVLDALVRNAEQWSQTPAGREQLSKLNAKTVALVATQHLIDTGKLLQVSERVARKKAEDRQGASTERPSGVSTTGAGLEEHYEAKPGSKQFTKEVVAEARRRFA